MNTVHRLLRPLRGANLEVFKFGMYLMFPIGWMYYFGTNLENRFSVPDFWPTQEQSHKIPHEREEIKAEVERIQQDMRRRREMKVKVKETLLQASQRFKESDSVVDGAGTGGGAGGDGEAVKGRV